VESTALVKEMAFPFTYEVRMSIGCIPSTPPVMQCQFDFVVSTFRVVRLRFLDVEEEAVSGPTPSGRP